MNDRRIYLLGHVLNALIIKYGNRRELIDEALEIVDKSLKQLDNE